MAKNTQWTEKGGVVRLRSGGPSMTIVDFYGNPATIVQCHWFNAHGELESGRFPIEAVEVTVK